MAIPNELYCLDQQRVAIGGALLTRPALFLADEPIGKLETRSAAGVFKLLRRVNREFNCAVLLVTYDPRLAGYSVRTINLVDGRIVSDSRN